MRTIIQISCTVNLLVTAIAIIENACFWYTRPHKINQLFALTAHNVNELLSIHVLLLINIILHLMFPIVCYQL